MTRRTFLKKATEIITVSGIVGVTNYVSLKKTKSIKNERDKLFSYYNLLIQWVQNKNENKKVETYFKENNLRRIAIYGAGPMGSLLYNELKDSSVEVAYFIDKNAENLSYCAEKDVVSVNDVKHQDEVDAIVITSYYFYDDIIQSFDKNDIETDVISLEDIIYSVD